MDWTTDSNGDHVLKIDGRERARLPFIPPDYPTRELTEIGLKQEIERTLDFVPEPATVAQWWMIESTTLPGQLGMIVCWLWANIDLEKAVHGVTLIPHLIRGETEHFSCADWQLFCDALEMYDERSPILQEVFEIARDGMNGKLPFGSTKVFPSIDPPSIRRYRGF